MQAHFGPMTLPEGLMALYDETEAEERSWQDYANCLGVDPDLFSPSAVRPVRQERFAAAAWSARTVSSTPCRTV